MSYSIAGAEEKKEQKKIQRQLEEAAEVEKKKQQEKRFHDECEKVNQIIDEEYKTQIEIIEQDLTVSIMKIETDLSNRCKVIEELAGIDYESYRKFKTYMREAFDELNHFNEISYNNIKNKDTAPLYRKDSNTELEKQSKMNME